MKRQDINNINQLLTEAQSPYPSGFEPGRNVDIIQVVLDRDQPAIYTAHGEYDPRDEGYPYTRVFAYDVKKNTLLPPLTYAIGRHTLSTMFWRMPQVKKITVSDWIAKMSALISKAIKPPVAQHNVKQAMINAVMAVQDPIDVYDVNSASGIQHFLVISSKSEETKAREELSAQIGDEDLLGIKDLFKNL